MSKYISIEFILNETDEFSYENGVLHGLSGNSAPSIDIVRCRECVKANTEDCSHSYWDEDWCEWRADYKGDDWFCADGERKEDE